jgi:hypothetical protein
MAHAELPLYEGGLGKTRRRDAWWIQPLIVLLVFSSFIIYATWAAFQNAHYNFGPYLSPFYSPELFGTSPHALLGPPPTWWPGWLPFSPALLILWAPGGFRFTCYYYRGAYYKSFWADPPNCAVGEPRFKYRGESKFPLIIQNIHRFFLVAAVVVLVCLVADVYKALWWINPTTGAVEFGMGVGTVVLAVNATLLSCYTFGCHSMRHIVGGVLDQLSSAPRRKVAYDCVSCLNRRHAMWAWLSLFSVALSDLYVRLCSMGVLRDWRIF